MALGERGRGERRRDREIERRRGERKREMREMRILGASKERAER
jgi:hypothetical protein